MAQSRSTNWPAIWPGGNLSPRESYTRDPITGAPLLSENGSEVWLPGERAVDAWGRPIDPNKTAFDYAFADPPAAPFLATKQAFDAAFGDSLEKGSSSNARRDVPVQSLAEGGAAAPVFDTRRFDLSPARGTPFDNLPLGPMTPRGTPLDKLPLGPVPGTDPAFDTRSFELTLPRGTPFDNLPLKPMIQPEANSAAPRASNKHSGVQNSRLTGPAEAGNISALNIGGPEFAEELSRAARGVGLHVTSGYRGPNHPLTLKNPYSAHPKGWAIDVRAETPEEADVAIAKVREMFASRGFVQDHDYIILDEVRKPSSHATKPHVHFHLTPKGAARWLKERLPTPN